MRDEWTGKIFSSAIFLQLHFECICIARNYPFLRESQALLRESQNQHADALHCLRVEKDELIGNLQAELDGRTEEIRHLSIHLETAGVERDRWKHALDYNRVVELERQVGIMFLCSRSHSSRVRDRPERGRGGRMTTKMFSQLDLSRALITEQIQELTKLPAAEMRCREAELERESFRVQNEVLVMANAKLQEILRTQEELLRSLRGGVEARGEFVAEGGSVEISYNGDGSAEVEVVSAGAANSPTQRKTSRSAASRSADASPRDGPEAAPGRRARAASPHRPRSASPHFETSKGNFTVHDAPDDHFLRQLEEKREFRQQQLLVQRQQNWLEQQERQQRVLLKQQQALLRQQAMLQAQQIERARGRAEAEGGLKVVALEKPVVVVGSGGHPPMLAKPASQRVGGRSRSPAVPAGSERGFVAGGGSSATAGRGGSATGRAGSDDRTRKDGVRGGQEDGAAVVVEEEEVVSPSGLRGIVGAGRAAPEITRGSSANRGRPTSPVGAARTAQTNRQQRSSPNRSPPAKNRPPGESVLAAENTPYLNYPEQTIQHPYAVATPISMTAMAPASTRSPPGAKQSFYTLTSSPKNTQHDNVPNKSGTTGPENPFGPPTNNMKFSLTGEGGIVNNGDPML